VRIAALERIEQAERRYKLGILVMMAVDAVFAVAFFMLMDFHDRLHWLIMIGVCGTCGVIVVCVINLSIYVDSATQTILKAIFARVKMTGTHVKPAAKPRCCRRMNRETRFRTDRPKGCNLPDA